MPALIDRAPTLDWMIPMDEVTECLAGTAMDASDLDVLLSSPGPVAWEDDEEDEDDEDFLDDDDDLDLGEEDEELLEDDEDDEDFDDEEEEAEEGEE